MNAAEFHAAWPKKFRDAAGEEGWALGLRSRAPFLYIPQDLWPDAGKIHHTLIYGQQLHHAAARELLKGSPEWPRIVRDALERRASEGL